MNETPSQNEEKKVMIDEDEDVLTIDDLAVDNIVSVNDLQSINQLKIYQVNEIITSRGVEGKVRFEWFIDM